MERFDFEDRFYAVNVAVIGDGDKQLLLVNTESVKKDDAVAAIEFFYANLSN